MNAEIIRSRIRQTIGRLMIERGQRLVNATKPIGGLIAIDLVGLADILGRLTSDCASVDIACQVSKAHDFPCTPDLNRLYLVLRKQESAKDRELGITIAGQVRRTTEATYAALKYQGGEVGR